MHSCIYRADPNVQSVVHVHPRYSILMSVLGKPLKPMSNSGGRLVRKGVPVYPHSHLILTDQHGTDVAKMMSGHQAVFSATAPSPPGQPPGIGNRHAHRRAGDDEHLPRASWAWTTHP
jgi:ribulose-5-phosphate 4-epimerase/fuculose-1-phosphate aldolase